MLPPSRLRRVLTLDENLGDTRHYLESPDGVTTIHEKTNGKKSSVDSLGGDKMANKKPVSERERELELEFADFVQWLEERAATKAGHPFPRGRDGKTRTRSQEREGN
jgi:hypothetical protein